MHWFDWTALILLAGLAAGGCARGLILQLSAVVAVALGLFGGLYLCSAVAVLLPGIGQPAVRLGAGFAVVFAAVALSVNLVGRLLKSAVEALCLGFVDRVLGAALGALAGVQLLMLVVLLVGGYLPGGAEWLAGTKTGSALSGLLSRVLPLLPDPFHHLLGDGGELSEGLSRDPL